MKFVVVEPITENHKITALVILNENGNFEYFQIKQSEDFLQNFDFDENKYCFLCFDILKSNFFNKIPIFLWDIKILHELLGEKVENLIRLSIFILGREKTQKYIDLSTKFSAYMRSYEITNIKSSQFSVQELLPDEILHNLYIERAKIITQLYLLLKSEDKDFYLSFFTSIKTIQSLSEIPLCIDVAKLPQEDNPSTKNIRKCTIDGKSLLKFNMIGAKTGRLGFRKNHINIYNLPRELRSCIVPSPPDNQICEIDFKSFQPRLAIYLTDSEEFKSQFSNVEDIYSVLPGDREKNKIQFLSWMFAKHKIPHSVFDQYVMPIWDLRNELGRKSKEQGFLQNVWGRKLYYKQEPVHIIFQNFITATEADCIFQLTRLLMESKIQVLFPYYDAIVCEVPRDNKEILTKIKEISQSFLGKKLNGYFPVSIKIGNDYGNLTKVVV